MVISCRYSSKKINQLKQQIDDLKEENFILETGNKLFGYVMNIICCNNLRYVQQQKMTLK